MSRIFKRPKSFLNEGSIQARNVRVARLIKDQDELDKIISEQPDRVVSMMWLAEYGKHMRFTPQTFDEIQDRLFPQPEAVEQL